MKRWTPKPKPRKPWRAIAGLIVDRLLIAGLVGLIGIVLVAWWFDQGVILARTIW